MVRGSVLRKHNPSGWSGLHIWSRCHRRQAQRGGISSWEKTSSCYCRFKVGILQALEVVLSDGGQPKRTLYVAFGHDEEVSFGSIYCTLSLESSLCIHLGERLCWCWAYLCPPGKDVAAKRRAVGLPPWRGNVCHAGQKPVQNMLSPVATFAAMQGVVPGVNDPVIYIGNK